MKSGKLPLEIDQNQTPRLTRGVCTVQSHMQTLRSRTLVRGGGLQRENLTENTTFCEQNYGTRGLAQSKMNTFDCEVLGGGTSTASVCDGLGDVDDEGEKACKVLVFMCSVPALV